MKLFSIITNIRDDKDFKVVFPECRESFPPHKVWKSFSVPSSERNLIRGEIIVLSLTGEMMMSNPKEAARRVLEAVRFAQERGSELIALTSLTPSVTNRGEWLIEQKGVTAALTHGDTYAAALTIEGVQMIARKIGRDLHDLKVAIVGAYGLIGKAVSMKLIGLCKLLLLIGPNPLKLNRLVHALPEGKTKVICSTQINTVAEADIIITATSNPAALITPQVLENRSKAQIIYEVSVPPNLPLDVYRQIRKVLPRVLKIDGAMASIPGGIDFGVHIPGVGRGTIFACWAEAIMQALEDDRSDHVGKIDLEHLNRTLRWGRKYGFLLAPFTCFGRPIPEKKFKKFSEFMRE